LVVIRNLIALRILILTCACGLEFCAHGKWTFGFFYWIYCLRTWVKRVTEVGLAILDLVVSIGIKLARKHICVDIKLLLLW